MSDYIETERVIDGIISRRYEDILNDIDDMRHSRGLTTKEIYSGLKWHADLQDAWLDYYEAATPDDLP